ncbi:hypothetical protein [Fictibacillus phosphorivorans]|nr:hypothetical protein [Fictibacillus phosphorivorans]
MKIKYSLIESLPKDEILEGILALHHNIFGDSSDLLSKMNLNLI